MEIRTDKIVQAFEENPIAFISAAGLLLGGLGKIITAAGSARGSHAYARDVNRRIKRDQRKR